MTGWKRSSESPLRRETGEREGPDAKRWEGEVVRAASTDKTHLTRSLRSHPLPPQAGGEGCKRHFR